MTQHYEYTITYKGDQPTPRAIKYPTWEAVQDALWNLNSTSPSHYVDSEGEVQQRKPEFDVHSQLVLDGWKVVTSEQTPVEDNADPAA